MNKRVLKTLTEKYYRKHSKRAIFIQDRVFFHIIGIFSSLFASYLPHFCNICTCIRRYVIEKYVTFILNTFTTSAFGNVYLFIQSTKIEISKIEMF